MKTFYRYLSPSNIEHLTLSLKTKSLIIRPMKETSKPVPSVFTAGEHHKEDVAKLLGKITVSNTRAETEKLNPWKLPLQGNLQGNKRSKTEINLT